jgi:hypothetical protein
LIPVVTIEPPEFGALAYRTAIVSDGRGAIALADNSAMTLDDKILFLL